MPTDAPKRRNTNSGRLSALQVKNQKGAGRYLDGKGLALTITKTGGKKWVLRFTSPTTSKVREMGLGPAGKDGVGLAEARQAADTARAQVRNGVDPIDQREAKADKRKAEARAKSGTQTFGEFAQTWMAENLPAFDNSKHRQQWAMTLTKYAAPLAPLAVNEITTEHVADALRPIWTRTPETAKRTQGRIERILDAAKAKGLRTGGNPARWKGHLEFVMPKQKKRQTKHHASLHWKALPDFMPQLRERPGTAARALEFAILCASRSGEVRGATWGEVDLAARTWTIPGDRMKAGNEHRVPLSDRALEILRDAERLRPEDDTSDTTVIFPGPRSGTALSDMALLNVLRRMKVSATPHGFRSSFRGWAEVAAEAPYGAIRLSLAHAIKDQVDAAYMRDDALGARRKLMAIWADFLDGKWKPEIEDE